MPNKYSTNSNAAMISFPSCKRGTAPLVPLTVMVLLFWLLIYTMRSGDDDAQADLDSGPPRSKIVISKPADPVSNPSQPAFTTPSHEVAVVVASLRQENTSWISEQLPKAWKRSIYVVDDRSAPLTVPKNKGREAMVYLTYIIDNYDSLPDVSLFIHASRFAWHNDNPDYDSLTSLLSLQIPYIKQQGYVNLRCVWVLGCPTEFKPIQDVNSKWPDYRKSHPPNGHTVTTKEVYKQAFEELLPGEKVPAAVGVSCCAQFAVSKDTLRTRTREEYMRWRTWLLETPLVDDVSGRVLEYMWHIIFGKEGVFCPSAEECYCKLYGWCNLEKCGERGCVGYYILPKVATLPQGWPLIGWDGEERNYSGPAL